MTGCWGVASDPRRIWGWVDTLWNCLQDSPLRRQTDRWKRWWTKGQNSREGLNSLFRVDYYQGCCWLCAHSQTFRNILHSQQGVCCRNGLSHGQFHNVSAQPRIICGSDATPMQPVIHPLNLPGVQGRDRCKTFLTTVKYSSLLWLTSTRGPSFLGSLPSGDTGKRKS